jgi:hypothetical protein
VVLGDGQAFQPGVCMLLYRILLDAIRGGAGVCARAGAAESVGMAGMGKGRGETRLHSCESKRNILAPGMGGYQRLAGD